MVTTKLEVVIGNIGADIGAIGQGEIRRTGEHSIVASRACPYNCTFCYHPSGSKYRSRSIDSIFEEVDFWVNKSSDHKTV